MALDEPTLTRKQNPSHTSHSDPTPRVTVLLLTNSQAEMNRSQAVHIYHDEEGNYRGHVLYKE